MNYSTAELDAYIKEQFGNPKDAGLITAEKDFPGYSSGDLAALKQDFCRLLSLADEQYMVAYAADAEEEAMMQGALSAAVKWKEEDGKVWFHILVHPLLAENKPFLLATLSREFAWLSLLNSEISGEQNELSFELYNLSLGFGWIQLQAQWQFDYPFFRLLPDSYVAYTILKEPDANIDTWISRDDRSRLEGLRDGITEAMAPQKPDIDPESLEAFMESNNAFLQGDYDRAISLMEDLLEKLGEDILASDALNNIGYYKLRQLKWDEAIEAFRKSLQTDPGFHAIRQHLLWTGLLTGEDDLVREMLENEGLADQDRAMYLRNMGLKALIEGERARAITLLRESLEYDEYMDYADLLLQLAEGHPSIHKGEIHPHDLQADYLIERFSRK